MVFPIVIGCRQEDGATISANNPYAIYAILGRPAPSAIAKKFVDLFESGHAAIFLHFSTAFISFSFLSKYKKGSIKTYTSETTHFFTIIFCQYQKKVLFLQQK
jgi:hypothetical protein